MYGTNQLRALLGTKVHTIYFPNICSDLILIQEHSMCPYLQAYVVCKLYCLF